MWKIVNGDGEILNDMVFESQSDAKKHLESLPEFYRTYYRMEHFGPNRWINRILTEGLLQNDLDGIILPQISVDEYIPSDTSTDNVVIAFFLKGVPEAVIPFKNFCNYCKGVLDVDYGDSETIQNTSIVYVEMDRENIEIDNIDELMTQIELLTRLEKEDFTMTFPHTDDKFPYDLKILSQYFKSRDEKTNRIAQKKAEEEVSKNLKQELLRLRRNRKRAENQKESLVNFMARL